MIIIIAIINYDDLLLAKVPSEHSSFTLYALSRRSLGTMTQISPEVRQIIERVLQLEKDRLDRKKNSPINDDILKIIKEVIK